ncbi:MAG: hypothetical protein ACD_21C00223G0006 [uncultured bacterium]|nr:MAG: hypothetical protein ACD_21C00223G0006 [uncultured bacterium]
MPNIIKVATCLIALFLSTFSLAATCAPGDTDCALAQKKLKVMDQMGIKPIATEDVTIPNENDAKPSKTTQAFQIPKPGNYEATDQAPQIQRNPGLKLPPPTNQESQQPEFKFQQPQRPKSTFNTQVPATQSTTQPRTSIYR